MRKTKNYVNHHLELAKVKSIFTKLHVLCGGGPLIIKIIHPYDLGLAMKRNPTVAHYSVAGIVSNDNYGLSDCRFPIEINQKLELQIEN